MALLRSVLDTIERLGMFRPEDRVGVAVSGGADSVALLYALVELAPRWNLGLTVLHINHMLRGEVADDDASFVEGLARELGLEFEVASVDVARIARETGDNLEQAGRLARKRFFLGRLESGALDRVATGHTRSDQAETVLYRLLRGAGTAGVAGIRPVTREGIVRPLIAITRTEVRKHLRTSGIVWREDATNQDLRLDRNRIRNELLPQLAREWNPAIEETLAGMATVAAAEEAYWEGEIGRLASEFLLSQPPAVVLRCNRLKELPEAVLRRLLRAALTQVRGDLRRVDGRHVERMVGLVRSQRGSGRLRLPGVEVARSFDWLRLAPPVEAPVCADYRLELPVPGEVEIPASRGRIRSELANRPANGVYNEKERCELDWGRVPGSLEVRSWRTGDRFQPTGRPARKMKVWFQRERIPLWERPGWPMVTCGDTIVWTRRLGVAEGFAVSGTSTCVLRLSEHGAGSVS